MTAPRDTDTRIGAFLDEGPAELSPRLLAAIRDDVHRTNQRAFGRPWRIPPMHRVLLVLAPLAAIVLVVGALALGGGSDAPPAVTAPPSPAASAAAIASTSPDPGSPPAVEDGEEWILFEGPDGFVSLIRPDGTGLHRALDGTDTHQVTPDWSPDGTQLLFSRDNGSAANLWIMNVDGTGGRDLTPAVERCGPCPYQWWARWSPDGTAVAFINSEVDVGRTLRNDLAIVDVATGAVRIIASSDTQQFSVPSWSPDGNRIVLAVATYASLATAWVVGTAPESVELAIVDLAEAEPALHPIPGLPAYPGHPDWHPDGTRIVFRTMPYVNDALVDPGAGSVIYTVAPDGTNLEEVFREPGGHQILQATAWAPDGGRIIHMSRDRIGGDPTLRMILDPSDGISRSATGEVITYGSEPVLRPIP